MPLKLHARLKGGFQFGGVAPRTLSRSITKESMCVESLRIDFLQYIFTVGKKLLTIFLLEAIVINKDICMCQIYTYRDLVNVEK